MSRYRILRQSQPIRDLIRETSLVTENDLIQPFFIVEGENQKQDIDSMPGIYRYSLDLLPKAVESFILLGGKAGLFFGVLSHDQKNDEASASYDEQSLIARAVRLIKEKFPDFIVMTDVCLCAYTNHGHCGIVENSEIQNDASVDILSQMALVHAQAGADIVAPSDMMDFRVYAIRQALDEAGFTKAGIMSYAVKYASAFYGPFRDAADSSPEFGDRKTYQMDPANIREAVKEAKSDVYEGADIIMVKPALSYLDVVSKIKTEIDRPVAVYSVSGEYSMIKAAAVKNWINEKDIVQEKLLSMKRAGADLIVTYHAEEFLKWQNAKS